MVRNSQISFKSASSFKTETMSSEEEHPVSKKVTNVIPEVSEPSVMPTPVAPSSKHTTGELNFSKAVRHFENKGKNRTNDKNEIFYKPSLPTCESRKITG